MEWTSVRSPAIDYVEIMKSNCYLFVRSIERFNPLEIVKTYTKEFWVSLCALVCLLCAFVPVLVTFEAGGRDFEACLVGVGFVLSAFISRDIAWQPKTNVSS